ncbi:unnamed protein product [Tuber melanosporum]|uniref:(Perigord truffle) hypothetical protein n=1 Tax=Tuber melanosporum (strain Mel28) TaxID=656061 RepID=D5GJR3_TUBMM|nr:uncharacterized protein GSTUM_00009141001 [Tuber melanosporum]CAZ84756.1 unnamed protein product [Tuber melanosporum]
MIKGIRKSLKGDTYSGPKASHLSITPKTAITIQPPKKVIRASFDYTAASDLELSFSKGDFFHVIGREDDPEWYEACNPASNARGLVPVPYFQTLGKGGRGSQDSAASGVSDILRTDSGYSDRGATAGSQERVTSSSGTERPRAMSTAGKSGSPLYGVVQYDFAAERPDELEAKAGEAIIVVAQSDKDWFVAKPIGRLGGPGLIPVDFIEIRDMATGQTVEDTQAAIARAGVPKVEEWKRMAAEYKNSSISLGRFDFDAQTAQAQGQMQNMSISDGQNRHTLQAYPNGGGPPDQYRHSRSSSQGQYLAPVAASVDSYSFENGRYWYVLNATMEDGRSWILCRFYEDFYDFQISLLDEFKEEAGHTGQPRSLPYMPGPVTYVTDTISAARRTSLDEYIKKLLGMPTYISRSKLVRQLFAPRPGDVETTGYRQSQVSLHDNRRSTASQQSSDSSREPSRQSSQHNLNGTNGGNVYPGLSAPPPRSSGQQPRMGGSNGISQAQQVHIRSGSDLQPPRMLRQDSSMSAATQGSNSSQPGQFMKVKITYSDDLIAIRLPKDVSYVQLQEKLQERLGADISSVRYKDEPSGTYVELLSDNDLAVALSRNPKLWLHVQS